MSKRSSQAVSEVIRRWFGTDREPDSAAGEQLFERFMRHVPGLAWLKGRSRKYAYMNDATPKSLGTRAEEMLGKSNADMDAEARLHRMEERLRLATQTGKIGVWDWDIATNRIEWTSSLYAIHGITPEQFDGTMESLAKLIHPDDLEAMTHAVQRALRGEKQYDIEFRAVRPDGSVVWLYTNAEVVHENGAPVRMVGATLDITTRKQTELVLRENEERMRLALRGANAGAWVYNANTDAAYWSAEFRKLFGFGPDVPCSLDTLMARFHPDDRARARNQFTDMVRSGEGEFRQEFRIHHPTLGLRWMLTLGCVERDRKQVRCHGISLDISRLKQVEDELRIEDRRKNEFLATLAHELRNPLAPIRNGLEILRLTHDKGDMAQQAREMMERQLRQMVRLIDDLLDLSRISRGKIELKHERVELASIVHNALEVSRPLIEQARHQLTLDLTFDALFVDADATRLAQVFANLLNNAAKYTNNGGHLHVLVQRDGDDALVVVRDNGIGIPNDMLPKVFDMFTQVDRSLEKAQGGLGIGLNIARQLIEMHGGSIEARSEGVGKGSEFHVRLPLAHGDATVAQPHEPSALAGGVTGLRILVADDNVDAAQTLAMMLTINGNEVRIARDGVEAIEVARSFVPQVVLLDIGMPRLNGYDACRRLRELDTLENCLIVATTGWGQDDDVQRSREAGFDHHLVKPVETRTLEELLAREYPPPRRTRS